MSNGKSPKIPAITSKQEGGDDGYCYVVRIDGRIVADGLTRSEVPYWKQRALEQWKQKQQNLLEE